VPHLAFQEPINALAVTPGAVWVAHAGSISRVDQATMRETATVIGADAVWVACCSAETSGTDGRLSRIDSATNRIVATIRLHGLPDAVGAGVSGVWVRGALGPVWHIDPAANRVVGRVRVPGGLGGQWGGVLVGGDAVEEMARVTHPGPVTRIPPV
jgi:DNA-binding beta-propeller fold protein YncE